MRQYRATATEYASYLRRTKARPDAVNDCFERVDELARWDGAKIVEPGSWPFIVGFGGAMMKKDCDFTSAPERSVFQFTWLAHVVRCSLPEIPCADYLGPIEIGCPLREVRLVAAMSNWAIGPV